MSLSSFALFGGNPTFENPIPVGQFYFPSWERYENAMKGIFEREYYTNQGPLTQKLEIELQKFLNVKHAICVSNATIGLIMAAQAMELSGKVILPAFTFIASAQSLEWSGLSPVFCDVDSKTHQLDITQVESLICDDVSAIMGINLWGDSCNPFELTKIAESNNIPLYFDSAHAFGCMVNDTYIGNFGDIEVFSFHATKILNATEGGCICTNDDILAGRLRNIRSSYGSGSFVNVTKTANGRMSEAQAAIALLNLEDFHKNIIKNQQLYSAYEAQLASIPGVNLLKPTGVSKTNYQYLVCMIDEQKFGLSRNFLITLLEAENIIARRYFYPGIHRSIPYCNALAGSQFHLPNTDQLCDICIQFPIGALVSIDIIDRICNVIRRAHRASPLIRSYEER